VNPSEPAPETTDVCGRIIKVGSVVTYAAQAMTARGVFDRCLRHTPPEPVMIKEFANFGSRGVLRVDFNFLETDHGSSWHYLDELAIPTVYSLTHADQVGKSFEPSMISVWRVAKVTHIPSELAIGYRYVMIDLAFIGAVEIPTAL